MTVNQFGHEIIWLEETHSTNTLVLGTESHLNNHGLVVAANHQTEGRGRVGRKWASVPGEQLQFSLVIHATLPREDLSLLSLLAGLAVWDAIERETGLRPSLKWPNDVFLNNKKVCGILVEMKSRPSQAPVLVVGIGINCNGRQADFPEELRAILTTIAHEQGGKPVNRDSLLKAILDAMESWYTRLSQGERATMLNAWRERAHLRGRGVVFPGKDGPQRGTAEDISSEGFLVIRTESGDYHHHHSGELVWED